VYPIKLVHVHDPAHQQKDPYWVFYLVNQHLTGSSDLFTVLAILPSGSEGT